MEHEKGRYYAGTVRGREGFRIMLCTNEGNEHDCFALVTSEGWFPTMEEAVRRAEELNKKQTN